MSAPWKGQLRVELKEGFTISANIRDGDDNQRAWASQEVAEALVHRANAHNVAWKIADGYKDSPCFSELLGEANDVHPCWCPVCGLRAIRAALASPEKTEAER